MRKTLDEAIKEWGGFNIVSGMGDDSAMMIAECYDRGYEPDAIIFCDTGNEWPRTYEFLARLSVWMMERDWSKLVVLKKRNGSGQVINVYDDNFKNGRMPPPVYGFKSCSEKFKTEVANRHLAIECGHGIPLAGFKDEKFLAWRKRKKLKHNLPLSLLIERYRSRQAKIDWTNWESKIVKAVGINADEESRIDSWQEDKNFEQVFPLVDWNIGEYESKATVERVGLYLPGKSSCFMCPNATSPEIVDLYNTHPLRFYKAIAMEYNVAENSNDTVMVDRVFVVDEVSGAEYQLENRQVKKTNKKIDLEKTFNSIPKKKREKLGLEVSNSQESLFATAQSELVVRSVSEKTNFLGLGRKCSWLDVVAAYQMTGQIDFISVGGDMCGKTECGT